MDQKEIVVRLRQAAATDPFNASVFIVFALRQRGRSTLTLVGVMKKMRREGFVYPPEKYRVLFKLLADLGIGTLKVNRKGLAIALERVTYSLQSIGEAAMGKTSEMLRGSTVTPRFRHLPKLEQVNHAPKLPSELKVTEGRSPRTPRPYQTPSSKIILTVLINDKPINIPVPNNLSPNEVAAIVSRFQDNQLDEREAAGVLPEPWIGRTTTTKGDKSQ